MLKNWFPLWIFPVLVLFATGTVWLRLTIVRTTYEINQVDREIDESRRARERIQLKLTALRSPRRLEQLARTKFGLSQPRMEQVIYFRKLDSGVEKHR